MYVVQAARPALQRVKAGQSFLKVLGALSAAPGDSVLTHYPVHTYPAGTPYATEIVGKTCQLQQPWRMPAVTPEQVHASKGALAL